jgi:hypothetical protein
MSPYGTQESRLIELAEAWKRRAVDAERALHVANDRIAELQHGMGELDKLIRELRWAVQCIGERTAPRPDGQTTADGTRVG